MADRQRQPLADTENRRNPLQSLVPIKNETA